MSQSPNILLGPSICPWIRFIIILIDRLTLHHDLYFVERESNQKFLSKIFFFQKKTGFFLKDFYNFLSETKEKTLINAPCDFASLPVYVYLNAYFLVYALYAYFLVYALYVYLCGYALYAYFLRR